MKRIAPFFVGMLLGGFLVWGSMSYHIVRNSDGLNLVPKRYATLKTTYLDVRDWTASDWSRHPDLVWTLTQNGRTDLMGDMPVLDGKVRDIVGLLNPTSESR